MASPENFLLRKSLSRLKEFATTISIINKIMISGRTIKNQFRRFFAVFPVFFSLLFFFAGAVLYMIVLYG